MSHASSNYKHGVSLVELSIVLVIIGLLISGIVYGVNMVQRTKMLKVGKEFEKYTFVINQFLETYGEYPGLMETAFDRWGTRCAPTAAECNCYGCNNSGYYFGYYNQGNVEDSVKIWRHLWLAGLLEKETSLVAGLNVTPGVHVPSSVFHRSSGFMFDDKFRKHGLSGSNPKVFTNFEHVLVLGHKRTSRFTFAPLFTPTEALYLIRKIDDGSPTTGKMRASAGDIASVTPANDPCFSTTGDFKTADREKRCILHYDIGGRKPT